MSTLEDFMFASINEDIHDEIERSSTTEYPYQKQFWESDSDSSDSGWDDDSSSDDSY